MAATSSMPRQGVEPYGKAIKPISHEVRWTPTKAEKTIKLISHEVGWTPEKAEEAYEAFDRIQVKAPEGGTDQREPEK